MVVIGAGIIGGAVGFELSKAGYRTLNVDKLPAAGYGSTSNSCAIIRFSYSTYDGVAMSWEGQHYWDDWANYLGGEVDEVRVEVEQGVGIPFAQLGDEQVVEDVGFWVVAGRGAL